MILYRLVLHHVVFQRPLGPAARRGRAPPPARRRNWSPRSSPGSSGIRWPGWRRRTGPGSGQPCTAHAGRHPAFALARARRAPGARARAALGHLRVGGGCRRARSGRSTRSTRRLPATARSVRPHAHADRPWLAATRRRALGAQSPAVSASHPSTCASSSARWAGPRGRSTWAAATAALTAELSAAELTGGRRVEHGPRAGPARLGAEARFVELEPDAPLPFGDGEFDLVLCAETVEHVRDLQVLLSEAAARSPPGGTLAVTTPATRPLIRPPHPLSPHLRNPHPPRRCPSCSSELGFSRCTPSSAAPGRARLTLLDDVGLSPVRLLAEPPAHSREQSLSRRDFGSM